MDTDKKERKKKEDELTWFRIFFIDCEIKLSLNLKLKNIFERSGKLKLKKMLNYKNERKNVTQLKRK